MVKKVQISHGVRLPQGRAGAERVAVRRPAGKVKQQSPFHGLQRPAPAEVVALHRRLAKVFGERRPGASRRRTSILDTVVGTILSQNTTNINSHRAFEQLKTKFPTWDKVRVARPAAVVSAIKCGGLAPKKTEWIQKICRTIHAEHGKTSLEFLRKMGKEEVHEYLEKFQGVGKKTSAIINLFDIGHPDMAVDTHIFRYAQQLGWLPTAKEIAAQNKKAARNPGLVRWPVVTRDTCYAHLDTIFPDQVKYSMHLILTDTVGGLPVVCGSSSTLSFDGKEVRVDGKRLADVYEK